MKITASIFFFLVLCCPLLSQTKFTISGKVDFTSSGRVVLSKNGPDIFFSSTIKEDTVSIVRNEFSFVGFVEKPEQFRLVFIDVKKITEPFFVDSGFQLLRVDTINKVKNPLDFGFAVTVENSSTNKEYVNSYLSLFNEINKKTEAYFLKRNECDNISDSVINSNCSLELKKESSQIRKTRDSILYSYSLQFQNSPIIPWLLFESIRKFGYNEVYEDIYNILITNIPPNMSGALKEKLSIEKTKLVGTQFPLIDLIDGKRVRDNKFTLVEFWNSYCAPCISQFEKLKIVYSNHHKKGFEIVAISVDSRKTKTAYQQLLKKKKYPWIQILDLSGIRTNEMNIVSFPTSYLLNKDGKIVSINIDPKSLDRFLKENL